MNVICSETLVWSVLIPIYRASDGTVLEKTVNVWPNLQNHAVWATDPWTAQLSVTLRLASCFFSTSGSYECDLLRNDSLGVSKSRFTALLTQAFSEKTVNFWSNLQNHALWATAPWTAQLSVTWRLASCFFFRQADHMNVICSETIVWSVRIPIYSASDPSVF